jgi:hypothetical protein
MQKLTKDFHLYPGTWEFVMYFDQLFLTSRTISARKFPEPEKV